MKHVLIIFSLGLTLFSNAQNRVFGTYSFNNYRSLSWYKKCNQLVILKDSTYQIVLCGELVFAHHGTCKIDGDTIFFKGKPLG